MFFCFFIYHRIHPLFTIYTVYIIVTTKQCQSKKKQHPENRNMKIPKTMLSDILNLDSNLFPPFFVWRICPWLSTICGGQKWTIIPSLFPPTSDLPKLGLPHLMGWFQARRQPKKTRKTAKTKVAGIHVFNANNLPYIKQGKLQYKANNLEIIGWGRFDIYNPPEKLHWFMNFGTALHNLGMTK